MIQEKNKIISVLGIGNAIVDIAANVDDDFLKSTNLVKGSMRLICEDESRKLFANINVSGTISGGSAANTIAGLAVLGHKVAFIGKVKDDELGKIFEAELKKLGVIFNTKKEPPETGSLSTASCIVLTTPDAQRTMSTCLGVAGGLSSDDIDTELIDKANIVYIEGYLWDWDIAKKAIMKAVESAKKYNARVAFSLSDSFCVNRHRNEFLGIIKDFADIVFANESEILSLFMTDDFNFAIDKCKKFSCITVITRSEKGSLVISGSDLIKVAAIKTEIIDSTGAGDLYAAGFLSGYLHERSLKDCGEMGSILASEIITHTGARPEKPLLELLSEHGL